MSTTSTSATSASAWSPASGPFGSEVDEDAPRLNRFSSGQGRPAAVKKPSASRGAPHHSRFPPGPRSITLSIALNALGDGWCTEKITTRPRPCSKTRYDVILIARTEMKVETQETHPRRERPQSLHHRRSSRRVQPTRRLVEHQNIRARDELHRDGYTSPLAPADGRGAGAAYTQNGSRQSNRHDDGNKNEQTCADARAVVG